MNEASAKIALQEMLKWRAAEHDRLELVHAYLHGQQSHPVSPRGSPEDLLRLARISRVNVMKIVVNSVAQCLYVDGFRQALQSEDAPVWDVWQANKMDRSQIGVHRSALAYGLSYATVLPGDIDPVIKGFSPRRMTAIYGDDEDWPIMALRAEPSGGKWLYRLYDEASVTFLEGDADLTDEGKIVFIEERKHDLGVTPVVRFLNEQDLDEDNEGEVEPLMRLQDQIDLTTFALLVAQHYAAFRQRYIIGWTAESENALVKASAARILTFEDAPDDIKIGEFEQTQLDGYISSREETLKQAASLSQTPVHELIGSLVNLSAEALVAAEAGQRRKVVERQTSFGESWEMVLELASRAGGLVETDTGSEVRWRDTEDRSLAATVDALGKIAATLNVPPQELWERIPGVTQQEVDRWKSEFAKTGAIGQLTALLDKQSKPTPPIPIGSGTAAA
jgi:hypothetical protein